MIIQLEKNVTTESLTKLDVIIQELGYKTSTCKNAISRLFGRNGKSRF